MAIITVSRGTLSGGEALAKRLSERLGCPAISREVIQDAAARYGLAEHLLSDQLMKSPSRIQRRLGGGDERRQYLIAIQSALAERAKNGDFIYHGHAGHLLLKKLPNVFKVRLLAPMSFRIRAVRDRQGLGEEEARKYIDQVDRNRDLWAQFLYHVDWKDPALYDVVIHLDVVSLDTACAMIEKAIEQPEFRDRPGQQQFRDAFALACRIKLKLAQDERTKGMQLDVAVFKDVARVNGKFLSSGPLSKGIQKSEALILEVVRQFEDIRKVEFELKDAGVPIET